MTVAAGVRPRILPRQTVRTDDGVALCTDVYLPEDVEPRPTVVVRTPYGRNRPFLMLLARQLSRAGFCFVSQDCRGRYQSDGTFQLDREEPDTRQTLRWLAGQEWCDGRAVLIGISIASYANLRTAAAPSGTGAEVAGVVSLMGVFDGHSLFYRDGALQLHWALPWATLMGPRHGGRATWTELPWPELLRRLPLRDLARQTGGHEEIWQFVIDHPRYGDEWQELGTYHLLDRVAAPTLLVCGWDDFLLRQSLEGHQRLADASPPGRHRLVVGDWNHQSLFYSFLGASAAESQPEQIDLTALLVDWLRRSLSEADSMPAEDDADVLLHVRGHGWIGSVLYPIAGTDWRDWFLSSQDGARSLTGDGALRPEPAPELGRDTFRYDPEDPVPTVGGAIWELTPADLAPGPADQSAIEERPDVLVYTSEPLPSDLVICGSPELELWASTTATDTDFTAKLVDVDRCGTPRIVQDGVVRCRYADPAAGERLVESQRPQSFAVRLGACAHRFAAGHRLRLEVSSSNFPKYDRNLNQNGPPGDATRSMVAEQTVFHGGELASRLRLPCLPPRLLGGLRRRLPGPPGDSAASSER